MSRSDLWVVTIAAMLFAACSGVWAQDAGALWQQYEQESLAAVDAARKGDTEAYQKHMDQAKTHLAEARDRYERAYKDGQLGRDEILAYAKVLDAGEDYDLSAEVLAAFVEDYPADAEAWLRLAQEYRKLGAWKEQDAVSAIHRALELQPTGSLAAQAHYALGDYFWERRLYDLAADSFRMSAEQDAAYRPATIALAASAIVEGKVTDATERLNALGAMSDAERFQMRQQFAAALDQFAASGRTFADTAANHLAYAQLLFVSSRGMDSILAAERAVAVDPNAVEAWNFLGRVCATAQLIDRARQAFEQSLALSPNQPQVHEAIEKLGAASQ